MRSLRLMSLVLVALGGLAPYGWCQGTVFAGSARGTQGVVTAFGMDLFLLPGSAGGYSPKERADTVAMRLNERLGDPAFDPSHFRIALRNREVVLEYALGAKDSQSIVTVDRALARSFVGASGSRVRVAQWWLALLRDESLLALGRAPEYTLDSTPFRALDQIHLAMVSKGLEAGKRVDTTWVAEAIGRLAAKYPTFTKVVRALGSSVPHGFEEPVAPVDEPTVLLASAPSAPLPGQPSTEVRQPSPGTSAGGDAPPASDQQEPSPPGDVEGEGTQTDGASTEGGARVLSSGDGGQEGAPEDPADSTASDSPAPRRRTPRTVDAGPGKRIRIGVAPGDRAEMEWSGGDKGLRSVEFYALDADGGELEHQTPAKAPYQATLKLTDVVRYLRVVTRYSSGVIASWTVPYREPQEQE
ncbi:MAG TPA: hypothetical protein VGN26_18055 [Armatimonadota bacterium]|jgi:hypothetical protein